MLAVGYGSERVTPSLDWLVLGCFFFFFFKPGSVIKESLVSTGTVSKPCCLD